MNDALDILNTVMDALIGALAVALQGAARAMLANIHGAEWLLAVALAGAAWMMLAGGRGWRAVGVLAFSLIVGAAAWLSWRTNHHGMMAQQAVLAALALHGLRGRGWTLAGKAGSK